VGFIVNWQLGESSGIQMDAMPKCLECDRFELRIRNLQTAIELARADAFKVEHHWERKTSSERLLQLTNTALIARQDYDRHRQTHLPAK
jgi:hypothetical protein